MQHEKFRIRKKMVYLKIQTDEAAALEALLDKILTSEAASKSGFQGWGGAPVG